MRIKIIITIISKGNGFALPSHSILIFLDFATDNGKFLISAGISDLGRRGQQLPLKTGADSLELSSIWLRTEPLHKQASFRKTLPRDVESLGGIIFVWASSYGTPNCHPIEDQRQP